MLWWGRQAGVQERDNDPVPPAPVSRRQATSLSMLSLLQVQRQTGERWRLGEGKKVPPNLPHRHNKKYNVNACHLWNPGGRKRQVREGEGER